MTLRYMKPFVDPHTPMVFLELDY